LQYHTRIITVAAAAALLLSPALGQDLAGRLSERLAKARTTLDSLNGTEFVKNEGGNVRQQFVDAEGQIKAGRPLLALESLSSSCASLGGLAEAALGWGSDGKGIEALEKDWKAIGVTLEQDRKKFPARAPASQAAFLRGIAELSIGQVSENYAAAFDYGKAQGLEFGAYYLGRAQGHMSFALFTATLQSAANGRAISLPDQAERIAALEKEIVLAYAKPGSTTFHSNYIVANSSIKLARELNSNGYFAGALLLLLRASYAFGQTQITAPPPSELPALRSQAVDWAKRIAADPRDRSIPEQYLQKAQLAIEAGAAEGEAAGPQRHRAALLLNVVLPKYFALIEGVK